jgi:Fe-S-cluster containining protein
MDLDREPRLMEHAVPEEMLDDYDRKNGLNKARGEIFLINKMGSGIACPFLGRNKRDQAECAIYTTRPECCRAVAPSGIGCRIHRLSRMGYAMQGWINDNLMRGVERNRILDAIMAVNMSQAKRQAKAIWKRMEEGGEDTMRLDFDVKDLCKIM